MSRLLEWNNLQEAADYLTGETGETWTQRMVLDAGEKESFKVRFVLPPGVEAGREAEFVGDKPQLMPVSINALLNDGSVLVGWVPFTDPISKHETSLELKPRPRITMDEIRIRGIELQAFATSEKSTRQTEQQTPAKLGIPKDAELSASVGRPSTIKRKAEIVRQIILCFEETYKEKFDPARLPGSAADLLDACQRIEKAHIGKNTNFMTSLDTFKGWLRIAGFSFPNGRTLQSQEKFWTRLTPETMPKIEKTNITEV